MRIIPLAVTVLCFFVLPASSQQIVQQYNAALFTTPLTYSAPHATTQIKIDGKLWETDWSRASWSSDFIDIEGDAKEKPAFATRMKMVWDDSCLYVAAQLQEPQLYANLRQHDTIIFQNNDFEIFIDPDNDTHQYFEIEVNALNTIFDLFMTRPYRNGADALVSYDVPGLQSAVALQGTLNKSDDTDSGWTVEMAIPFQALNFGFRKSFAPVAGSFYRINFSRVEWDWDIQNNIYTKKKDASGRNLPEHNWVWSPQGLINMHYPERWGYLFFNQDSSTQNKIPASEEARQYLWLVYYKQQDYMKKNNKYALRLSELQIPDQVMVAGQNSKLQLSAISQKFVATIHYKNKDITIDETGKVSER